MNFEAVIVIVGLFISAILVFDEKTKEKFWWAFPFGVVGLLIFGFIFIGWMFLDA